MYIARNQFNYYIQQTEQHFRLANYDIEIQAETADIFALKYLRLQINALKMATKPIMQYLKKNQKHVMTYLVQECKISIVI